MMEVRKSDSRGLANHGWLKSRHTFSFADYHDPRYMGFRSLRVINEDRIEGGTGFGSHPHRDMEIISYVVKGALQHKDSMGNVAVIRPGEVQKMSAGSGVVHSEVNDEKKNETHFFQIWIQPDKRGGTPGYGQKSFESELESKPIVLVLSKDAREGSIGISQDADLYLSRPKKDAKVAFSIRPGRHVWIQVVKGRLRANGQEIETGDAASLVDEKSVEVAALEDSEFMLFDLA